MSILHKLVITTLMFGSDENINPDDHVAPGLVESRACIGGRAGGRFAVVETTCRGTNGAPTPLVECEISGGSARGPDGCENLARDISGALLKLGG